MPAPMPAMLPAPVQATPVAPAAPAVAMPAPQAMQVVQAVQAQAGAAYPTAAAPPRFRVALVLDWFKVPLPWLRPVAVPAAAVEYAEPQTVLLVQAPPALPPCGPVPAAMPAPVPGMVPGMVPAMVPGMVPGMVPACAAASRSAAALDAQRCADLQRAVEALAREMERAGSANK